MTVATTLLALSAPTTSHATTCGVSHQKSPGFAIFRLEQRVGGSTFAGGDIAMEPHLNLDYPEAALDDIGTTSDNYSWAYGGVMVTPGGHIGGNFDLYGQQGERLRVAAPGISVEAPITASGVGQWWWQDEGEFQYFSSPTYFVVFGVGPGYFGGSIRGDFTCTRLQATGELVHFDRTDFAPNRAGGGQISVPGAGTADGVGITYDLKGKLFVGYGYAWENGATTYPVHDGRITLTYSTPSGGFGYQATHSTVFQSDKGVMRNGPVYVGTWGPGRASFQLRYTALHPLVEIAGWDIDF